MPTQDIESFRLHFIGYISCAYNYDKDLSIVRYSRDSGKATSRSIEKDLIGVHRNPSNKISSLFE